MTQAGPLRWRTGAGWLVLAGGGRWQDRETEAIDSAALCWADLDRPIAVLPTAGSSTAECEAFLEYLADLGGPSGAIVPIFDPGGAHGAENCKLLAEAGLVYISDGPDTLNLVRSLRGSPALEALEQTFDAGAVALAIGAGAVALGSWVAGQEGSKDAEPGWGWLPDAIVEPHFTSSASASRLRALLGARPQCLGLGIPEGSALALGPDGRVETVGQSNVTVVVGV